MRLEEIELNLWGYMVEVRVANFTRAIEESPLDPDVYYRRGREYASHRGFHANAIEDYSKAIGLDSGHLNAAQLPCRISSIRCFGIPGFFM